MFVCDIKDLTRRVLKIASGRLCNDNQDSVEITLSCHGGNKFFVDDVVIPALVKGINNCAKVARIKELEQELRVAFSRDKILELYTVIESLE